MTGWISSIRKHERAQSLVEFSLIIPLFLILVFGVIDFGMGLRAYITVAQATREGARYASVGNPAGTFSSGGSGECNGSTSTTTVGKVCSTMGGLDLTKISSVSVTYPDGNSPGNTVHVAAQYNYAYITPLRRLVNFFSAGSLGSTIAVSSSTDMRLE
ncbi:MAG: pilus assembly protein [Chloroflexi bacterium]|nr:pilus assembly protein [Chloroflexota bacterium]